MMRQKVVIALLVALAAIATRAQEVVEGPLTYSLDADGTASVVLGDQFPKGNITVAESVQGHTVTALGWCAFNGSHSLKTVSLPASVTLLGDYAFNHCDSLTTVVLGDAVTAIGERAFARCERLRDLELPASTVSIGDYAFFRCRALSTVGIGANVSHIGAQAFRDCNQLAAIEVSALNTAYASYGGVLFTADGATLITSPRKNASWRDFIVPDGTREIAPYAFHGNDNMRSIDLPSGLTSIGEWALASCGALKEIILPSTVTQIGANALAGCSRLTTVQCQWREPLALTPVTSPFGYLANLQPLTLYVPAGTAESYRAAEVWRDFGKIVEMEESQVEPVARQQVAVAAHGTIISITGVEQPTVVEVYDLAGREVYRGSNTTIDVAAHGVYIVRAGMKTFKVATNQ